MEKIVKPGCFIEAHVKGPNIDKIDQFYVEGGVIDDPPESWDIIHANAYKSKFKGATVGSEVYAGNETYEILNIFSDGIELFNYLDKDLTVQAGSVVEVIQDDYKYNFYIAEPDEKVKISDGLTVINTNAPIYNYLKGKKAGEKDLDNPLNVYEKIFDIDINHVYTDIEDYETVKYIKECMDNEKNKRIQGDKEVVDVTIDGIQLNVCLFDKPTTEYDLTRIEYKNILEFVHINEPLYNALIGKGIGETFKYKTINREFVGQINDICSLEKFELMQEYKESLEEYEQGEKIKN